MDRNDKVMYSDKRGDEKHDLSKTHLVFTSYKDEPVPIGYFTLSAKTIIIVKNISSKSLQKRINKFTSYSPELRRYMISAPLIAQLGINYSNEYNRKQTVF